MDKREALAFLYLVAQEGWYQLVNLHKKYDIPSERELNKLAYDIKKARNILNASFEPEQLTLDLEAN